MKKFRDMNKAITDGQPSNFVEGLYVQNGRLINDRPDGMMGIEKAAMMKNMVKKQEKIQMISDGILRAKMSDLFMD
tara:strand:- start:369 stop:596 length:228 start_codon:yes stop_codon:yes gene_type:complete